MLRASTALALMSVLSAGNARAETTLRWAGTATRSARTQVTHSGPLANGRHARVIGPQGPVHVWIPSGYDRASAGIVAYVHGYFTDIDTAFAQHRLAEQFERSGRNALFMAPEAPSGRAEPVFFRDLRELLEVVESATGLRRPDGILVAVAHSGGYRTLDAWSREPRLHAMGLLDAAYGDEARWLRWLESGPRRLVVIAQSTRARARALGLLAPTAVRVPDWPARRLPSGPALVLAETELEHMALVEDGLELARLLRALALPALDQ